MIKAEDFKQTWEDVGGLSSEDKKQWIAENMNDLPSLINWMVGYSGLKWRRDTMNVRKLPACKYCGRVARFRGMTLPNNHWEDMCEACFETYGEGLGSGIGYKLELVKL